MSSSTSTHPRVVVTSHRSDGKAVFAPETEVTPFHPFGPAGSSFATFHTAPTVPASVVDPLPSSTTTTVPRAPPAGITFCTTELPVGRSTPMHRTISLDYGVVLSGQVVLELDEGEEKILRTGDVLIQRGTMHAFHNRGSVPCQLLCVLIASDKVVLNDGTALEAAMLGGPGKKP